MNSLRLKHETASQLVFANPRMGGWLLLPTAFWMIWFAQSKVAETSHNWFAAAIGVLFATLAILGALWRFDVTFDLSDRRYRGRKGFWPTTRALAGSLTELEGVALERVRGTKSRTGVASGDDVAWSVRLLFRGWDRPLSVFETRDERDAHAKLEYYARKFNAQAIDRTGEREVRRGPKYLNRKLANETKSTCVVRPEAAVGNPPQTSSIVWSSQVGQGEIVLPPLGLGAGSVVPILLGLTFTGIGVMPLLALSEMFSLSYTGPVVAGWTLGVSFVVIGLLLISVGIVGALTREVVRERGDGLCFSLEFRGRSWRNRFFLKRTVEDASVKPALRSKENRTDVVVRSDDARVRLAGHLSADEQDWLARALRLLLCR